MIDQKAIVAEIDVLIAEYKAIRQRAKHDDCSDLPEHETVAMLTSMAAAVRRLAPPGSQPHEDWTSGPLVVTVNPEVGLGIGGKRTVGKLYFKDEPLTKRRAEIIAHLMDRVLGDGLTEPARFAVIDVRRGKAFEPSVPVPAYDALLAGEAASFAAMFAAL
jgi:hypothetical protein